jgi:hypothetical protein
MSTKYCVVAMRGDLSEFMEMIDFARVPSERIGSMNSQTVLVATFVSKFSMFELHDLFQSVKEVNFFLMDVDKSGIFIDRENVRESLFGVFEGFEERYPESTSVEVTTSKPQLQVGFDYNRLQEEVKGELLPKLKKMTSKEKKEMLDEILDRMPNITQRDKITLSLLSKNL